MTIYRVDMMNGTYRYFTELSKAMDICIDTVIDHYKNKTSKPCDVFCRDYSFLEGSQSFCLNFFDEKTNSNFCAAYIKQIEVEE